MPVRARDAITVPEIRLRLQHYFPDISMSRRTVERHMNEMSSLASGPVVDVVGENRNQRYYLNLAKLAKQLMSEENALNLLLARHVLSDNFGSVEEIRQSDLQAVAEHRISENPGSPLHRIHQRVRVLSDGIGRCNARIDPDVQRAVFTAIGAQEALRIDYVSSKNEETIGRQVNPQGLVAKDGTLYLLATQGLDAHTRHYPLHRIRRAEAIHQPVDGKFDIDQYIRDSHKLSHVLDSKMEPVELVLRVAPEMMYHLIERPLTERQKIAVEKDSEGWSIVRNHLPITIQLVPFLLSLGGWVEVVSPDSVRQEMKLRLEAAARHYA